MTLKKHTHKRIDVRFPPSLDPYFQLLGVGLGLLRFNGYFLPEPQEPRIHRKRYIPMEDYSLILELAEAHKTSISAVTLAGLIWATRANAKPDLS